MAAIITSDKGIVTSSVNKQNCLFAVVNGFGIVKVNGEVCTARGKKIHAGDTVSIFSVDYKIITDEN